MTPERDGNGPRPLDDEQIGEEPIRELADLRVDVTPGFLDRVRNRVERRVVTTQFLSLAWHVPAALLLEFLNMVFGAFGDGGRPEGDTE